MTEASAGIPRTVVSAPLPGLETVTGYQVRPLPEMTLFSTANRFLKFEFPSQRDYDLCLLTVNKGILSPQFSRNHLLNLPLKTIEQLADMVLRVSCGEWPEQFELPVAANPYDLVLQLIIALEEAYQYDLQALTSEDLALMEAHPTGSLHGFYFKPGQTADVLAHLLQSQGYRHDFVVLAPEHLSLPMAYWLCRRLTVVFPWSATLKRFSTEHAGTFPYLYRLYQMRDFLEKHLSLPPDLSADFLVETLIPQIQGWIREVFPLFSQEAKIPRPVQELVLAEGSTEELLIPAIARAMGYNLDKEGILIQPVGGKNQMLQQYVTYAEHLSIPISIVMDQDAQSLLPDLTYYQREDDRIFILEEGEFEDIYALELIIQTVNRYYQPQQPMTLKMLKAMPEAGRVKTLQTLWQELGLGVFDKVKFAQALASTIQHEAHLSPAMKHLIERIIQVKSHVTPVLPG